MRAVLVLFPLVFWGWLLLEPFGPDALIAFSDLALTTAGVGGGLTILSLAQRLQGRDRVSWRLIGAGVLCWGLGQAVWSYNELVLGQKTPFPSWSDVGYLAMIPLLFAGLVTLPGAAPPRAGRLKVGLDAFIAMASIATVSWFAVLGPLYVQADQTWLEKAIGLAYPAGDLLYLFALVGGVARGWIVRRNPIVAPLLVGCGLFVMADLGFTYLTLHDAYASGSAIDIGWPLGVLFLTYAAVLRWSRGPTAGQDAPGPPRRWRGVARRYGLYGLVLVVLTLVYVSRVGERGLVHNVFVALALLTVLLVMTRQLVTAQENERLNHALRALSGRLEALVVARTTELAARTEALEQANTALRTEVAEREQAETAVQDVNRRLRVTLDELATTQEQMMQQERMRALGQLASGIAHDFNNALSPIVGFSELLLMSPGLLADEVQVRRYLELIHTGGLDAAAVVRRLREFYRPREAGEGTVPVDAHRLVADVVALTQPRWKDQAQAGGRPVRVVTDLAPVPPIAGRAEELRGILTNLVFNAVDALPEGGTITLRVHPDPAPPPGAGGHVVVEVRDDGVGMTEAVRQQCLDPFFTTRGRRGTGLGLAMVYGVVRRHNGTLEIDSAPGQGTTVRLRLPAHAPVAGEPRAVGGPPPPPGRRLRVLVVDDEPLVRETTVAYLTAEGHRVRTAANGQEALAILDTEPFDLVVTDRAMPDVSGDTVARAAAALRTPVILLTGFGDLMVATEERVPGVARILSKPVTATALREAVATTVAETAPDPAR
jgi:signal transduction histidine kinase